MPIRLLLAGLVAASLALTPAAMSEPLRIYLDADQARTKAAGLSIQLGMQSAIDALGGTVGGHPVELVVKDHRGHSIRSRRHLEQFAADKQAFAVFCGLDSPPVLSARDYIHDNSILMLAPWAVAGPITRGDYDPHWIFRLSVDDTKAGGGIAELVVDKLKSKQPRLPLERTGGRRSNEISMTKALVEHGFKDAPVNWFDWGVEGSGADRLVKKIVDGDADAVMLVANAPEGRELLAAFSRLEEDHAPGAAGDLGIAGELLKKIYPGSVAGTASLALLQARAESALAPPDERVKRAVAAAVENYPELAPDGEKGAAVGFVHAYDLMLLLDAAVRQAGPQPSVTALRSATRDALETLREVVPGLLRDYEKPFTRPAIGNPGAHEALAESDLQMFRVDHHGAMQSLD
jgi:branched-chain amino acid transport system substrate-binding protein